MRRRQRCGTALQASTFYVNYPKDLFLPARSSETRGKIQKAEKQRRAIELGDNIPTVFSIQEYVEILRRRRWIILQEFVLIAVIGVAQALMAKNVYRSRS